MDLSIAAKFVIGSGTSAFPEPIFSTMLLQSELFTGNVRDKIRLKSIVR
jgi:hypothetical protein